jgi:hypothetical protein
MLPVKVLPTFAATDVIAMPAPFFCHDRAGIGDPAREQSAGAVGDVFDRNAVTARRAENTAVADPAGKDRGSDILDENGIAIGRDRRSAAIDYATGESAAGSLRDVADTKAPVADRTDLAAVADPAGEYRPGDILDGNAGVVGGHRAGVDDLPGKRATARRTA